MTFKDYTTAKMAMEKAYAQFIHDARAVAREIAYERFKETGQGWVTANCVRSRLPIPPGVEPRAMGPVFNQRGVLINSGTLVPSARRTSHGRQVPVHEWVGDEERLAKAEETDAKSLRRKIAKIERTYA